TWRSPERSRSTNGAGTDPVGACHPGRDKISLSLPVTRPRRLRRLRLRLRPPPPPPPPPPAPGEAAASARARRRQRRAEPGREVADRQRARPRAEVAGRADPEDRALVVQFLGHVQVGALEHALRDPERDPVDEEALPELERRGRRL